MQSLFLFALLLVAANGQLYSLAKQYNECGGDLLAYVARLQDNASEPCVPITCACRGSEDQTLCGEVICDIPQAELPEDPDRALSAKTYSARGCAQENLVEATVILEGLCFSYPAPPGAVGRSILLQCGAYITSTTFDGYGCTGSPSSTLYYYYLGVCVTSGQSSAQYKCSPACIHGDSKINYQGQEFSFDTLPKDCSVPHTVTRNGVKITTSCPDVLRLTHEHLVMTPDGWKEAGSIAVGETLFSQIGGGDKCIVKTIETEENQKYSGLNCVESEVVVNGYWISTFGKIHLIPSLWMKYTSKVLGVETASQLGDKIASWWANL